MNRKGIYRINIFKVRQLLSIALCVVLLFGVFAESLRANVQIQVDSVTVDDVYYVLGEDTTTGDTIISPTMTVSWIDPDEWATEEDISDIHDPDFYTMILDNLTMNDDYEINFSSTSDEFTSHEVEVHEKTNLETGSLYELTITPYHYHEDDDGDLDLATMSGVADTAYAITDLDVDFESDDDSITVIWDDVGSADIEYRIVYALGDYSGNSKQELIDNQEGQITGITNESDDITSYYDSVSQRNKLSYLIDENIYPGQVYSILVEPTVDYYQGVAVARNRNYPLIRNVSTDIELTYTEESDKLKLQWEIPSSFLVSSDSNEYELTETRLMKYVDGQASTLAILYAEAGAIGYYTVDQPIVETGYQLELTYEAVDDESKEDIEPVSNYLVYSPTTTEVTPTKPEIPDLLSKDILDELIEDYTDDEVRDILEESYLVPESTYLGSFDDLFDELMTYHYDSESNTVNLAWSAFRRIDVDQTSDTYNEYITDMGVYYDIWVTDSYDALTYATALHEDLRYSSTSTESIIYSESDDVVGYHETLAGYYNGETGTLDTLVANQVYYVKLQAKKVIGSVEYTSEPTIATFYFSDDGDAYEPPYISDPPLRVVEDDTTTTEVTIGWQEEWWEIIDPTADDTDVLSEWTSEVWIDDDGTIYTDEVEDAEYFPVYESEDEVAVLEEYLEDIGSSVTITTRSIDLGTDSFGVSNVYYQFSAIEYVDVQEAIEEGQEIDSDYSFLDYYDALVTGDQDGSDPISWDSIDTYENPDNTDEILYTEDSLLPNTSYLFLLYPYRVLDDGTKLYSHYPSPIVVATEPEDVTVNPDPTVPSMYITDTTDRTITLSWRYNTDFEYEIVQSDTDLAEDGTIVEFELPEDMTDDEYPEDGEYYEVTASDLFPDTGYYFFIRATQTSTSTVSSYSNPVFGVTDDVKTPDSPRGIGVPSDDVMEDYGYDGAVEEDSIAISWLLDTEDTDDLNDDTNVMVYYSYILECSNNAKFIAPIYVVSGDIDAEEPDGSTILDENLVVFTDLLSNQYYYFRMKTRVTVIGTEEGQEIIKESAYYSTTLRIITDASDGEYDSSSDPALEILPSENYEIIYDPDSFELIFRFRDSSEDADGNADNNVDQRLISDLINRNLYEYEIDISGYNNKPVTSRVIQIPYSIIEAFDSYEIETKIDTGNLLVNLPHDSLLDEVERQKNNYGGVPMVEITIEDVDGFSETSRMPEDALVSVSVPQDMDIKVKSDRLTTTLDYSDVPMEIGLITNTRYEIYGKDPIVYTGEAGSDWTKVEGSYDRGLGAFMVSTRNIGSFGVYLTEGSEEIVSSKSGHWSERFKDNIDSIYTLDGLSYYNPDASVSEDELINIIYDIVMNEKEIDVSEYVNSDKLQALYYSGVKADTSKGASGIKREEAIAMMMSAIEIREDLKLDANFSDTNTVNNNGQISNQYKEMIAKAATYGLVSDLNQLRPQDYLTYAELFALWSKAEEL